MSDDHAVSDASERSRFASREYVSRVERELGTKLSEAVATDQRLAYETGYLRGCSETLERSAGETARRIAEVTDLVARANDEIAKARAEHEAARVIRAEFDAQLVELRKVATDRAELERQLAELRAQK